MATITMSADQYRQHPCPPFRASVLGVRIDDVARDMRAGRVVFLPVSADAADAERRGLPGYHADRLGWLLTVTPDTPVHCEDDASDDA